MIESHHFMIVNSVFKTNKLTAVSLPSESLIHKIAKKLKMLENREDLLLKNKKRAMMREKLVSIGSVKYHFYKTE